MHKLFRAGVMAFGLVANVHAGNLTETDTGVRTLHPKTLLVSAHI